MSGEYGTFSNQTDPAKTVPVSSPPQPPSQPQGQQVASPFPPPPPPPGGFSQPGVSPPTPPQNPPSSTVAGAYNNQPTTSFAQPTPQRPPAATKPGMGSPTYLPSGGYAVTTPLVLSGSNSSPHAPAGPPSSTPQPVQGQTDQSVSKWGWRAAVAFLCGGLVAAAGFGSARLGSDTVPTPEMNNPIESARELPEVNVAEPAAYVADVLGPAVVQIETDLGIGSGVIYADGLVLTNNHVVEDAAGSSVKVRMANGRTLDGTIVGADQSTDIAVVSVGVGQNLPIAELAIDEEIDVGQLAIAIGSPFQLQQSVTAGIVSAVNRPVPNQSNKIVAMIQTDAPINPGNSGGALADKDGRVIGINTAIQTDGYSSTNAGVGFAVPIDTALRIANLLVDGEPIKPGFLGIKGEAPSDGSAGVEITEVTAGSAALDSGIETGDRVLTINGAPVTSLEELAGLISANQAGDQVTLEVVRDGQNIELEATLGERPED